MSARDIPAVAHRSAAEPVRRTAVCVPGYTGSKEDFGLVAPLLAARGHRVLAYDQRGQYESPGPDDAAAYSIAALSTDLLTVVDLIGDVPVHLLGHSFGGLVARAAVIARPTAFCSLTLLDSGPAALTGPRMARMDRLQPVLESGGMAAVWQVLAELDARSPGRSQAPPELTQWLRQRFLASSPAGLAGMGQALRDEPDRVAELAATAVPALVCYGENDDAWSPDVQVDMANRLGAACRVVAGAAHSPATEAPRATARVLHDFWSTVEAGGSTS